MNSDCAYAKFPFSRVPENLVVGVGTGVADELTTGDGDDAGDAVGDEVGVGDGERVGDAAGLAVGVGDGDEIGVGEGEGVMVGTKVAVPLPGHVWERRMPESIVLIVARDPNWTIRSRSFVRV